MLGSTMGYTSALSKEAIFQEWLGTHGNAELLLWSVRQAW